MYNLIICTYAKHKIGPDLAERIKVGTHYMIYLGIYSFINICYNLL